jgi:penicillin-binding protein 1C
MRKVFWTIFVFLILSGSVLSWQTITRLLPTPTSLSVTDTAVRKVQLLDRQQRPLTITYQNRWNIHDYVPLHEIPESLQTIFVLSEDKRFFDHSGADWWARLHATWQNLKSKRVVRGASTITEQVGRIINPRPRTFWSRWLEGFEALQLEKQFSKADILEFYLNQVPYASQRRGVVQAARYYFDRHIDTLSLKEMIALAVLVRSPSRLDLHRGTKAIERSITRLTKRLYNQNYITQEDYQTVLTEPLQLRKSDLAVKATHFAQYVYTRQPDQTLQKQGRLSTTLDAELQKKVQKILDERIATLHTKHVHNGAVLVVDHHNNEVLAWVNAGRFLTDVPSSRIDAVITPRQPGSTLKPFLYALALEKGWTAATFIQDTPLAEPVGTGMHTFHNYSHHYYGALRLRDALGNSLNVPAIRTVRFVSAETFLQRLHRLGMNSLTNHPDYYGDGLALGNGAVTLFELVQAYSTLANQGVFQPLRVLHSEPPARTETVFSPEVSTVIANILSDPDARRLEFGRGALLRFPIQTAIKTGTSTDYRDAWSIGFNHHYTVGVWLGNLNQQPMSQVSGATGAALLLRTVFAELNRYEETQPLPLSPELVKVNICRNTGQRATANCPSREEWFIANTEPSSVFSQPPLQKVTVPYLKQPSTGLQLAMDPRIPDQQEAFALMLAETTPSAWLIEWLIDENVVGITAGDTKQFLWTVKRGTHLAQAKIWQQDVYKPLNTPTVTFTVK